MSHETQIAVRNFLQELTNEPFIDADEDLFARGLLTSLTAMAVVDWIETKFSLTIEGDDLTPSNLGSVRAITAYVGSRLSAVASATDGGSE